MTARIADGKTRVQWVTTLSSLTSPTATQINAGVDITSFVLGDGLDVSPDQNPVDLSTLDSTSELQGWGRNKLDSALIMKRDTTDTAWTTFSGAPLGYLVVRRGVATATTFAAAQKVEVYHVQASKRISMKPAANEMEKFQVKFGLQSQFEDEVTVA